MSVVIFVNRMMSGIIALSYESMSKAMTAAGSFFFFAALSTISVFFYFFMVSATSESPDPFLAAVRDGCGGGGGFASFDTVCACLAHPPVLIARSLALSIKVSMTYERQHLPRSSVVKSDHFLTMVSIPVACFFFFWRARLSAPPPSLAPRCPKLGERPWKKSPPTLHRHLPRPCQGRE